MHVLADEAVAAAGDPDAPAIGGGLDTGTWSDRLDAWVAAALDDYPAERALHDVLFPPSAAARTGEPDAGGAP